MKLKRSLLVLLLIAGPVFAASSQKVMQELVETFPSGDYQLVKKSDSDKCPQIKVNYRDLRDGTKLMMLDPRLVFNLDLLKKEQAEKVPDGCHYTHELSLRGGELTQTTSRFDCPKASENGVDKNIFKKIKSGFTFQSVSSGKVLVNCSYEKGGK